MTDVITIRSLRRREEDTEDFCQIDWGPLQSYAPVRDVRQTAEDLFTAAAYADLIEEFLSIGLPGEVVSKMVSALLQRLGRPYLGAKTTLTMIPAGTTATNKGAVALKRGSRQQAISPEDARGMARNWLETAEGSEADSLFARVLQRSGWLNEAEISALFGLLKDIRSGVADVPPPRPS